MTEIEHEHSIKTLTSGAMVSVWEWTKHRIPSDVEVCDAHAHIGMDLDGRTMTAEGMRERMLAAPRRLLAARPFRLSHVRTPFTDP